MENKKFAICWGSIFIVMLVLCIFSSIVNATFSRQVEGTDWESPGETGNGGADNDPPPYGGGGSGGDDDDDGSNPPSTESPPSDSPSDDDPGYVEWTEETCKMAGWYWVNGSCKEGWYPDGEPEEEEQPEWSKSETACVNAGYIWMGTYCQKTSDTTASDKTSGPTCGGSGNGWTIRSCVQFGNVWDNTSGCCEAVKVTEQEANSSKKTEHSNESYTITVTKDNGSVIKYNYNKDGKLMSIITTDSNGNQSLDTTENSNLNGSIINYYNNLEECKYMVSDVNSYCVPYKGTYVTVTQARTKMTYKTEEECKQTTGLECEYRTYPDDPQKGYFMSVECDCDEKGDCLYDPEPKPGNPDEPTIKDPVDDIPTDTPEPGNPDVDDPKPEDRGEGCYKNKDTGEFKWFEKDPELNSETKLYERVNDSNCKHNITENPQTGEIAMFFIWIIAFGAVGYSVWYYMKSRKES